MNEKIKLLHIYDQPFPHEDVYIVGNTEGLVALKEAIEKALESSLESSKGTTGEEDCVYVADGEGYSVNVIRNDSDWQGPFWQKIAVPYSGQYYASASHAVPSKERQRYPWDIWEEENP